VTLSVVPIHVSITIKVAPSIYRAIDMLSHTFIWLRL
jgi:hypothetical protein